MIGRKIVDRVDELLHAPELPSSRYLQPPPLRVDTSRRLTPGMVLYERTNTPINPNDPVSSRTSAHPVPTPNTSLTFGVPNPTTSFPARVESPCGSVSEASSRSSRYSIAEQALASALKNSENERSPLELQICALQQATVALNTRAKESRERAAKLKLSLTERDTEPDMYVALQQERWMEERRQTVVDKEVEQLTQHLKRLKADRGSDQHEDENHGSSPALDNEAKRSANLSHFLDHSPTKTSFNLDLKCRLALDQQFPRRITMSDVSPLRLRPSSVIPPLRRLTTKHARPMSMAGEAFNPVKRPCRPRLGNSPLDIPPLTKGTENSTKVPSVSERSISSRSSCVTAEQPPDGSEGRTSTRPSTPPLSVASEASSSSQGVGEEIGGIATIISHVSSRTRSEILADLDEDAIHVPDYAVNLLGGFDLIHDEFSLPDRELFIKPREMTPIEVAPPPESVDARPSEESDTGPYMSFALPPFSVETSWSHPSLNSPSPSTPRLHRPSLQPLTPDSSSFSRSSTPSTPRPSQSSKGPRARHSLLFYMRKHRENSGDCSPASSSFRVESLPGNSPVSGGTPSKKRFSFFSRK